MTEFEHKRRRPVAWIGSASLLILGGMKLLSGHQNWMSISAEVYYGIAALEILGAVLAWAGRIRLAGVLLVGLALAGVLLARTAEVSNCGCLGSVRLSVGGHMLMSSLVGLVGIACLWSTAAPVKTAESTEVQS